MSRVHPSSFARNTTHSIENVIPAPPHRNMEPVASVRDSGYAIHAGILSANECDTLARELSRDSIPRTRAGAPSDECSRGSQPGLRYAPCRNRSRDSLLERGALPRDSVRQIAGHQLADPVARL